MTHTRYWRCIRAACIDGAIVSVVFVLWFIAAKNWVNHVFTQPDAQADPRTTASIMVFALTAIWLVIDMCIFVFVPRLFGGTPGQYIASLRLVMRDNTKASLNAIMLKHCMSFILIAIALVCFWLHALVPLSQSEQVLARYVLIAVYGWLFLNLFVMACNPAHRSVADVIADTSVTDKRDVKPGYRYIYVDDTLSAVPESELADNVTTEESANEDGDAEEQA